MTGHIDIKAAYDITDADRKPNLRLVTYYLTDTLGDNDGRPDAGDTIAIYPVLRNDWGEAHNIKVWMELAELENDTIVTFIEQEVDFGRPLSSYAKNKSLNPIRFVIDKNVVDGRRICMVLKATCDNMEGILEQEVILTAENGVEIGGMITEDLTLYPDVHYIVTKPIAVPEGVTLTLKPGTVLKFKENTGISMANGSYLIAQGRPDSIIVFTKADLTTGKLANDLITFNNSSSSQSIMQYCKFENIMPDVCINTKSSIIMQIKHCIFTNLQCSYYIGGSKIQGEYLHVYNNESENSIMGYMHCEHSNIVNNKNSYNHDVYMGPGITEEISNSSNNSVYANICQGLKNNFNSVSRVPKVIDNPQYWGSNREDIIREGIWDIEKNKSSCYYDLSKRLTRPSAKAHGIVWKVVVNGYDAQDEFEMLPPLGVGKHKFEVYFNRPMDTSVAPTISMGVRAPYTQNAISEDGSWSADSTIYTAYLTITGKTASDGLNRIYVYGAEDDEHFEIPEENVRFNVQVAAAGSLSTGLMAEAGLGKVALTWQTDEEDFEDLLGYNIYRWTEDTIKWDR
jgi:hypothetical protein